MGASARIMLEEAKPPRWHEEFSRAKLRHVPASGQPASVCTEGVGNRPYERGPAPPAARRCGRRRRSNDRGSTEGSCPLRSARGGCCGTSHTRGLDHRSSRGRQPLASTEARTSLAPDPESSLWRRMAQRSNRNFRHRSAGLPGSRRRARRRRPAHRDPRAQPRAVGGRLGREAPPTPHPELHLRALVATITRQRGTPGRSAGTGQVCLCRCSTRLG